jgi:hypothetical protein
LEFLLFAASFLISIEQQGAIVDALFLIEYLNELAGLAGRNASSQSTWGALCDLMVLIGRWLMRINDPAGHAYVSRAARRRINVPTN